MRPFLAILLVSLGAGACNVQVGDNGVSFDVSGSRASDEWTRTYTLPEGGRLEIVNINGGMEISASTGREVRVRAEREVRGGSEDEARKLLEALVMQEDVAPDSVRIQAQVDEDRGPRRVNISYDIEIPPGLVISLKTENGRIRFENVNGQLSAVTTNGGIFAERLSGSLTAEVVNGGIELNIESLTGDMNLSSVNGGIELVLPVDVKASLDATTVNGGVNVEDVFRMAVTENSRRRVAGTFNGGGVKISATTVNGGVRIGARDAS
jgi:hypothetical protein